TLGAVSAIDYAVTMKNRGVNIRTLNNSWGGGGFSQLLLDAINQANDAGILFVAAAGNSGTNNDDFPHYPSSYNAPNVIAVARTNHFDNVSQTSSFGARTVHVGAPGTAILSTTPNNNYSFFSGTSMATPHVTGVAALLLAQYPNIPLRHLRASLLYSGDPIAGIAGRTINDRRLDAYQALLQAAVEDTTPPAITGLRITAQTGRRVTVQFTAGDDGTAGTPALYQVTFTATSGAQFGVGSFVPGQLADPNILTFNLPYRHTSGTVTLKVADEDGNEATASISVAISAEASEPYTVAVSDPASLSSGGSPLALTGDDRLLRDYPLPPGFAFPFFGQNYDRVSVSTNGILYFSPPRGTNTDFNASTDAGSSTTQLNLQTMIAGLWDDIDINHSVRPNSGVFFEPRGDSLVFRWQGVRFQVNTPINAEIELRRDGTIITRYGDGNANLNAVIGISGGQSDTITGPQTDAYVVNSHTGISITLTNAQTVIFTPRVSSVQPPVVSFSAPSISFGEGSSASATLTVTRTGDLSGVTSVNYATIDNPAAVRCDDTTTAPGVAFARCDYATSVDTITFQPGQDTQQIQIPVIDDSHVEPDETFQVSLNNPTGGATLGAIPSVTVTIIDNDVAGAANPVNTTPFFVRQQYLDFLSREPEAGEPWSAILNGCPNPFNTDPNSGSASCDRILVSSSFFGSPEFRLKGFYVFIHYRVAFSERFAEYSEIVADMRSVTGQTSEDTVARRAQFPISFTGRQEFRSRYDALTQQGFVDALLARYPVSQITAPDPANPEGGQKVVLTRGELVNRLTNGTLTRAQVLRAIVESDEVSGAEFNRAFVAMQYYGYLRRTPEQPGYDEWL
ncbi:MAG: S8 family serine peptidase, partial [Acidobacteriota bacterium]|nr:S8 family serine peptidase [Acidobacteriota bacterium]